MVELRDEIVHCFGDKLARRRTLARLSYPDKVRILIKLQKIAAPLLTARGEKAVIFRSDD
jgi:hypothetical protein